MYQQPASQIAQRVSGSYRSDEGQHGSPRSVQPLTRREATGSASGVIADIDGAFLVEVVTTAMAAGYGLTFSATSDGGALSVTLLTAQGRFRDYCTNLEHLKETLGGIRARATTWLARNTPEPPKRSR